MANKHRVRGKALERWVGLRLGWRRRFSGEYGGYDDVVLPDGQLAPVSVECKSGYGKPQLREVWLTQAKRNAGGRPWVIVQRPLNHREPIVSMGWTFFEELLLSGGYVNQQEVASAVHSNDPGGSDSPDHREGD